MRANFVFTKHSSADRYLAGNSLSTIRLAFRTRASFTIAVAFARRASNHQRAGAHEARPKATNLRRQPSDPGFGADQQIQVENKKRLDGTDLAAAVPDDKILVVELLVDGVFDEFIISA